MIVIALAAGVLGLITSFALRRSSYTPPAGGLVDEKFIYLSLPGFSLLLLGAAAVGLAMPLVGGPGLPGVLGTAAAVLGGVVAGVGFVFSGWGLFGASLPDWAKPKTPR